MPLEKFFPDRKRLWAQGKTLHIHALERHTDLRALNYYCDCILRDPKATEICFVFEEEFRVFPNMMAPLAALLCFLKEVRIKVTIIDKTRTLDQSYVFEPIRAVKSESRTDPSDVVWEYRNSDELEFLIDLVLPTLYAGVAGQTNVLLGLEYCLSELMDNVQRHSGERSGFMIYKLQSEAGRIAIGIADQGKGIKESFTGSKYRPKRASDAISLAMRKGVTSSPESAGNGLWTTTELITANSGRLTLTSGGGAIFFNRELRKCESFDNLHTVDPHYPGTHIDFQLDFRSPINFQDIWGKVPAPINIRCEQLEDIDGRVVIKVAEQCFGTSTRKSGSDMRLLTSNLLLNQDQDVILDFSGITMISSSFADEAIAKIIAGPRTGPLSSRVKTTGTTATIDLIINDALRSRAAP